MFIHKGTGLDHPHETVEEARDCEDEYHYYVSEAAAEVEAEKRNERFFEERGGGYYAGSPEEARDRWFDSLIGL